MRTRGWLQYSVFVKQASTFQRGWNEKLWCGWVLKMNTKPVEWLSQIGNLSKTSLAIINNGISEHSYW